MQKEDWFNNAFSNAQLAIVAARHWLAKHNELRDFRRVGRCTLARTIEELGVPY